MPISLFPWNEYWWFYGLFVLLVAGLLALDLGVFHRKDQAVSFREATTWVAVWVALALIFNYALYRYSLIAFAADPRLATLPGFDAAAAARRTALEFLAGYLVEESLSVDNVFVFVLVFRYFAIPARFQHRVLFFGILGAMLFRGIFISAGAVLMQYHWVVIGFGLFLLFTAFRMLKGGDEDADPESNPALRLMRRFMPVTQYLHGHSFLVREAGRWVATPLLVVLVAIETADVVFALDSVPAVYGLTHEPLIVFTSNIFAILGLRSMYFVLAGAIDRFWLLRHGVALVLLFVGIKMVGVAKWIGYDISIGLSLGVIVTTLAASILLSLAFPRPPKPPEDIE
jgi:tellurite resistance protein TerC